MGRTKSVGKVEPVNKLWLSAKEAMPKYHFPNITNVPFGTT